MTWDLGVPASLATGSRVEFLCNALIIAPVSLLGSLLWPRLGWPDWTAYAFVEAGCVELIQPIFLLLRSASFADRTANALGAALGALVAASGYRLVERRS